MKSRYFPLKVLIVLIYLASVGVTLAWVAKGWDDPGLNDLGADIAAVPGATAGRTLVVVTNRGELPWTNVTLVLNDTYAYSIDKIDVGEQKSLSLDEFAYTYAIPRPWTSGVWRDLAGMAQPQPTGHKDIDPKKLDVVAKEGIASATLGGGD